MQPKESKSHRHFYFSIFKSTLRIVAFLCLAYRDFSGTAILLTMAELLGIAEEI